MQWVSHILPKSTVPKRPRLTLEQLLQEAKRVEELYLNRDLTGKNLSYEKFASPHQVKKQTSDTEHVLICGKWGGKKVFVWFSVIIPFENTSYK